MWYHESVFYQIAPLGFCGAPERQDEQQFERIYKVQEWIPYFQQLGINAIYFCPVFMSDSHGYDTREYSRIDPRLGSNAAFREVCDALHAAHIRVVLDGVFNHVGRGFWAFQDVLRNRENSPYLHWFHIDLGGSNGRGDGLWYEGWEGCDDLVKLNLDNPEVVEHLFNCIRGWVSEFQIDGLRLDVAYMLPEQFLRSLRYLAEQFGPAFFLLGEAIHGDYNRIVRPELLHSCTNYECFKGMFSSLNDGNFFEIAYSLKRQFGQESWALYRGMQLLNFLDNHDVSRIASNLKEKRHLPLAYALLFGIPGIPCVYYGSEWGQEGVKTPGSDSNLRPCFAAPVQNALSEWVGRLAQLWRGSAALQVGAYREVHLTNRQFVFLREAEGEQVLVALNAAAEVYTAPLPAHWALRELLSGHALPDSDRLELQPYSVGIYAVG